VTGFGARAWGEIGAGGRWQIRDRWLSPICPICPEKVENHAHAIAIHFMYYNFGRVHKTLKTTPAIAAGVTDRVWSLAEIVGLLD
jgi:hypothetical protein